MNFLLIVCIFTAMIHLFETAALSLRLAGARTGQIATSLAFVNTSFLVARLSNMLQAPLLGSMVDHAILQHTVPQLFADFRWVVLAAFLGNLIGVLLFPTMVQVSTLAIQTFEHHPSLPKLIFKFFTPRGFKKVLGCVRLPGLHLLSRLHWRHIPKLFLLLNVLMVSIYCVGVLASLLAAAILPEYRATASQLSGIVNGMATIMLALLVDPTSAHITDQAVRGKRDIDDVRTVVFFLLCGRLLGSLLLAQLMLAPAADYIVFATQWVSSLLK